MGKVLIAVYVLILQYSNVSLENNTSVQSRVKRYLAFPDGATLTFALCMQQRTPMPSGIIFTEGVNWGMAYQLPNKTTYLDNLPLNKHVIKRRDRKMLYENVETIMNNMGFNGRACIMRALCLAPNYLKYKDKNLAERIVGVLFKYPLENIEAGEPEEHNHYLLATQLGHGENANCDSFITECPISILDLILKYLDGQIVAE
ncbi:hypothetical protein WA026_005136 [Henosepilachna vigintioctopunctata]|uniref:Uncharacterized protein n=1 Tax=Henosepilachna vigintioctopunctata TaxID=420089 RepID=A0AAW1UUM8_9CUCU